MDACDKEKKQDRVKHDFKSIRIQHAQGVSIDTGMVN